MPAEGLQDVARGRVLPPRPSESSHVAAPGFAHRAPGGSGAGGRAGLLGMASNNANKTYCLGVRVVDNNSTPAGVTTNVNVTVNQTNSSRVSGRTRARAAANLANFRRSGRPLTPYSGTG